MSAEALCSGTVVLLQAEDPGPQDALPLWHRAGQLVPLLPGGAVRGGGDPGEVVFCLAPGGRGGGMWAETGEECAWWRGECVPSDMC
jgi:hypothetical protein